MVFEKGINVQKTKDIISTLFIIAASAELVMAILDECRFEVPYSRYILWGFLVIYGLKVMCNLYSIHEYAILALVIAVGMINYKCAGMNSVLKAGIFLFALRGEDWKKVLRCLTACLIVTSFIMYIRAIALNNPALLYITDIRIDRGNNGIRYTFGYLNSNRFMGTVISVVMLLLLLADGNRRKALISSIIAGIAVIVFYLFTDTRTALILVLSVILLYNAVVCFNNKMINYLAIGMFAASFIGEVMVSVMATCHVDNAFMQMIDDFISGRFHQLGDTKFTGSNALVYVENWHLFSSHMNQAGCDLGYVFIFYYYGIIAAIMLLMLIVYTAVVIYRRREYYKFVILMGLCTYIFMEIYFFSNYVSKNLLLVFCGITIWQAKQGEEMYECNDKAKTSKRFSFAHIF